MIAVTAPEALFDDEDTEKMKAKIMKVGKLPPSKQKGDGSRASRLE